MLVVELLIFGVIIGFASGFFGIGGGTLLVPSLMYLGFGIKYAIGISVVQMVFSSVFGSYLNHKRGTLVLKEGAFLGLGGLVGAQGSGYVVDTLSENTLAMIFMGVVILSIVKFFTSSPQSERPQVRSNSLLFIVGMMVGLLAISIGVGGGLFLTPILVGFMNYDLKKAVSMSLFFIVFSSISGSVSLLQYGYVDYKVGLIVGFASLLGVFFGTKYAHIISRPIHKKLLLVLYCIILVMIVNKLFF